MPLILPATTPAHLDHARGLFREYAQSIACNLSCTLMRQGFDAEVASLPGKYAIPRGRLFLAYDQDHPVACIALRPLPNERESGGGGPTDAQRPTPDASSACEMKRLYVRPSQRGTGLGRRLCHHLIAEARAIGYTQMMLDTDPSMQEALALYASLGFKPCSPYNNDGEPCALFFSLPLRH